MTDWPLPQKKQVARSRTGYVRLFLFVFLVMSPLAVIASAPSPQLKIIDHVDTYTVTAHTASSIRKQLENRSDADGKPRHGSTRSTFEVLSKFEEVDGSCHVLEQEIVVEITTELPQWEPVRGVNLALKEQWKNQSPGSSVTKRGIGRTYCRRLSHCRRV